MTDQVANFKKAYSEYLNDWNIFDDEEKNIIEETHQFEVIPKHWDLFTTEEKWGHINKYQIQNVLLA